MQYFVTPTPLEAGEVKQRLRAIYDGAMERSSIAVQPD
jgi:hypothetical protein